MKITYIGDKEKMIAFGFDFSGKKTRDIPDDNKYIPKFLGNMFFKCESEEDTPAPKYWVREIKKVPIGMRKVKMVKENINLKAFTVKKDAEEWVRQNGTLDKTHYIVKA